MLTVGLHRNVLTRCTFNRLAPKSVTIMLIQIFLILCKLVFREYAARVWLFKIFLDTKLSPTEAGMKKLYEFQYCLEFISAVCLKLDLYLSSSHFWVRVCVPVFKILRALSMNKSTNNVA